MHCYVVIDLEMCRVPVGVERDAYGWKDEIIQIGAVLVNNAMEITDTFATLVSPQHGTIDAFIENLTGISGSDVQTAPCFRQALGSFLDWLPKNAVPVSWSNNDKIQLQREMTAKGIVSERMEVCFEQWIDAQSIFAEKMDTRKKYKLSEALIIADIRYNDGEHDALVDAKNTAQLFIRMETETVMRLSPYYSIQAKNLVYTPFAALLSTSFPAD